MSHCDGWHILFPYGVAQTFGADRRRRRLGVKWSRPASLNTSVHVGLVVVTDVSHVVTSVEHTGYRSDSNVKGASIAADDEDVRVSLSELLSVKFPPFGLGVERDTSFKGGSIDSFRKYYEENGTLAGVQ